MDTPFPDASPLPDTDLNARYCIQCAYHLAGLPVTGKCPECGTLVELSLREPTLSNAGPEYLASLQSGLTFILNAILVQVAVGILGVVISLVIGLSNALNILASIIIFALSALSLFGYWRFTEPDPSQVALEKTSSARAIVRITVFAGALIAALSFMATFVEATITTPSASTVATAVSGFLSLAEFAAGAVLFFGVLRYARWLATRIPDQVLLTRAQRYMWLLPILYTVGALAIGLGPLVALVLYWNFLNRLRTHIRAIIATGTPADIPSPANRPIPMFIPPPASPPPVA